MIKRLKEKIKGILASKSYEINLTDIVSFLEEHSPVQKKKENSADIIISLKDDINKLEKDSVALKNAQLRNDKIDKKMIHIMEGNRDAYLKRIQLFISSFSIPKDTQDIEIISNFVKEKREELDTLNKNTARAFYVLREFFGREVGEIAKSLKSMDEKMQKTQNKVNDEFTEKYDKIIQKLSEVKDIETKKKDIKDNISKNKEESEKLKEQIEETQNKINALKRSERYAVMKEKGEKVNDMAHKIKEKKENIKDKFKKIIHTLKRKYPEDIIVNNYELDPVDAYFSDRSFQIYSKLSGLKESIGKNLEVKNADEVLEIIDEFSLENLKKIRKDIEDLESNKRKEYSQISNEAVMRDIYEFEYKQEHAKDKIDRSNQEIESLEKALLKYDSREKIVEIEELLRDITKKDVRIIP